MPSVFTNATYHWFYYLATLFMWLASNCQRPGCLGKTKAPKLAPSTRPISLPTVYIVTPELSLYKNL